MISLPRLYVKNQFERIIHPTKVSLTLNMMPMSCASMELPKGESVPMRSAVEMFCPYGSVGMFRARTPQNAYGDGTTTVELEHMICELADYLVKEEISKMMAGTTAARQIFSHYKGGSWKLGSVSALGSDKISVSINYDNVLNGLMAILSQKTDCMMSFNFGTKPWTLDIVKKPTVVDAECRLSRNMTGARITYDDSEMCTRVYYERMQKEKDGTWKKDSKGHPIISWKYIDASTKGTYGLIERTVSVSSELTDAEAQTVAKTFLEEHKNPRLGVEIDGVYLADITGEGLDKFSAGKLLRVVIPEDGVRVEKHIRSMSWSDLYRDPRNVTVMIGDEDDKVVTFLHNLDSTGNGSKGGGGGGGKPKEKDPIEYFKKYETEFLKTDEEIELLARENSDTREILKQAGLSLNRNGVLVYASNKNTNLKAMLNVESNRISLVVKGTGPNAKIDAASIVAGINARTGSFAQIKAKQIDLDGYVTAKELKTERARINNLIAGKTSITGTLVTRGISSNSGSITSCTVGSNLYVYGSRVTYREVATPGGGTVWCLGR